MACPHVTKCVQYWRNLPWLRADRRYNAEMFRALGIYSVWVIIFSPWNFSWCLLRSILYTSCVLPGILNTNYRGSTKVFGCLNTKIVYLGKERLKTTSNLPNKSGKASPSLTLITCLFSWHYNPLSLYFHSPVAGFSLLVFEVSWSHTTRHSR
jgi:hypothetical protein